MFMGCVLTHGSGPTGKPKSFSQGPNLTQVPEIGPTHVPSAAGKGVRWWCPVGEGKKEFKK